MLNFQQESHPDYAKLEDAKRQIEDIIHVANEHKRVSDNLRELINIQSSINWSTLDEVSAPCLLLILFSERFFISLDST